jgi:hypothetical protein
MARPPYNPPPPPRDSAGYIPWWLLGIVAALFVFAALGLASVVIFTRPAQAPQPTATAVVITAAPPVEGALPTPTVQAPPTLPPAEPTSTAPPPPAGDVTVGSYVQVTGTGSAGFLNLRSEPNIESSINYLAIEREVLQVQAGPAEGSGFTWWYLVDPATNTRFGWAVQNYLQVVTGP